MNVRPQGLATLAAIDATALGLLHGVAVRTLGGGLHGDVDRLSVDLAATGLFLAAVWLGVGLLAGASAAIPGAVGVLGERLARLVLPAVIRRVLAGSVGLGVLLTPVSAGAQAATSHPVRSAAAPAATAYAGAGGALTAQGPSGPGTPAPTSPPASSLPPPTWPTTPSPTAPPSSTPAPPHTPAPSSTPGSPHPPAPSGTPAPPSTPPAATPAPSTAGTTTVRAGDSLWMLARHRLGTHTDDAEVDAYWRAIYRQNRAAIGDDPNLIRPGQHLMLPAPPPKESTR